MTSGSSNAEASSGLSTAKSASLHCITAYLDAHSFEAAQDFPSAQPSAESQGEGHLFVPVLDSVVDSLVILWMSHS